MASRPTRLLIVRHGQSTWNADGRWQGQADPPLSALGAAQAQAAADVVPDVDLMVASDLARARQTAEIIATARQLSAVRLDERLRERNSGDWTGFTREEIELAWPGWLDAGRLPENFEQHHESVCDVPYSLTTREGVYSSIAWARRYDCVISRPLSSEPPLR